MSGEIEKTASVLFIAPQPFYEDRGTPIAVYHTLLALSELGARVDLLTYPSGQTIELPGLRTLRVRNPLRIRRIPIGLSTKKLILDVALTSAIFSRIRHGAYTSVHAVEESVFPALVAAKRVGLPVIYDMQSCLPEQLGRYATLRYGSVQRILRALEKKAISGADRIVCSSGLGTYVRRIAPDKAVHEWRYPGESPGVRASDVEKLRRELKIEPESEVVLYTGNFEGYQDLAIFFNAMPAIFRARPRSQMVLVGASSPRDYARVKSAVGDSSRVTVVPRQPRHSLDRFLALADVLVSPRRNGGNLPLKIFDYMSAGKAIVAVDSATNRTVLDADRACLVPPNSQDFANAVARLLGNRETAAELGARARRYALKRLSRKLFLAQVAALYPELGVQTGAEPPLTRTALP